MSRLKALIEQQPDLTLDEVICAMRKHKVPSSRTAVWRFFQRHKITFKKSPNLFAPAYAREGRGASFNPLCTCMRACARGAVRSSLRSRRSRRRRFAGAVAPCEQPHHEAGHTTAPDHIRFPLASTGVFHTRLTHLNIANICAKSRTASQKIIPLLSAQAEFFRRLNSP
jgi:hypothetical protein